MKFLLANAIFFSIFGSSFAYQTEVIQREPEIVTIFDPIWDVPMNIYPSIYPFVPSASEIALTAKLDSQELRMNLLFDALDSTKLILSKQEASIKKLKHLDAQNKFRIKKEKRLMKQQSEQSIWIISLLAISTAICAFYSIRLILLNRKNESNSIN